MPAAARVPVDGNAAVLGQGHHAAVHELEVRALSHGHDHGIARDPEFAAWNRHRAAAAIGVRLAHAVALALERDDVAGGVQDHADRRGQLLQQIPFLQGTFQLLGAGRHLPVRPPVDERRGIAGETPRRAYGVHRGVTAADDQRLAAEIDHLTPAGAIQKIQGSVDASAVDPRDLQRGVLLETGRDVDRVEALFQQRFRRPVDVGIQVERDAKIEDAVDVALNDLPRQPEDRHQAHHPGHHIATLEDAHLHAA